MMEGTEVRQIRRRLAFTQAELAERIGVTANTVARWERGEVMITEPMAKLIAAEQSTTLNAPLDSLTRELRAYFALSEGADKRAFDAATRRARRALVGVNNYISNRNREIAAMRLKLRARRVALRAANR